jgi:hypothetical protein
MWPLLKISFDVVALERTAEVVSICVSTMSRNQMERDEMKNRKGLENVASIPREYMLLWIGELRI